MIDFNSLEDKFYPESNIKVFCRSYPYVSEVKEIVFENVGNDWANPALAMFWDGTISKRYVIRMLETEFPSVKELKMHSDSGRVDIDIIIDYLCGSNEQLKDDLYMAYAMGIELNEYRTGELNG